MLAFTDLKSRGMNNGASRGVPGRWQGGVGGTTATRVAANRRYAYSRFSRARESSQSTSENGASQSSESAERNKWMWNSPL